MEIGNQIRRLRLRKDVTQEAMAHHLGVTPQAVSKWERNSALPDISLIPALSAYFGVTIDELFAVSDDTRVERIQNMIWDERYLDPAVVETERKFLLEKAKREPDNDTYHELLADIEMHLAKEHMELAEEYSKEALRRNPENPDAFFSLVQAMGGVCRDWYAANHHLLIDFCKEFIAEHPGNWRAYMWLMDHLLIDNRIEEAKAYFDEFTTVDDSYRVEMYWGKLLWHSGNQEGGMAVWQQTLKNFPDQWYAWLNMGNMMAQTGNYEAAKAHYRKALSLQTAPRYLDALESIAQICEVQNDLPGAIAAWQEELEYLDKEWHCTTGETADAVRREIARLQKKCCCDSWSVMNMRKDLFDERLFHIPGEQIELRLIDTYEGKGGSLPFYWWDIILKSDQIPIGKISFRIGHNYHNYYNGNIGYEIDEAFRGHHYALQACQLILQAAQCHNMSRIYLTCDCDNVASYKTIERLGAVLLEEVCPPEDYLYYHEGIAVHKIYELKISR